VLTPPTAPKQFPLGWQPELEETAPPLKVLKAAGLNTEITWLIGAITASMYSSNLRRLSQFPGIIYFITKRKISKLFSPLW